MKSVRIRSDFTVKLPEELRGQIVPGDSLEVVVSGSNVIYRRAGAGSHPNLREMIGRIRANPPTKALSEAEIERTVHDTRRRPR